MDDYPCSAEIAPPAQKQPSEPGQSVAVRIRRLCAKVLFRLGRTCPEGKCILCCSQTLIALLLKISCLMGQNRGKVKKKLAIDYSRTRYPAI